MLPGFATSQGTARYVNRFPDLREAQHFRQPLHVPGVEQLRLSSIGLGTYLGEADDATDHSYIEAIATALRRGINVLDTAINYRNQQSERNVGAALQQSINSGEVDRDEIVVCTKAGYLSFDGNVPADPRAYFVSEYIDSGIIDPRQLAGGMHCMSPAYLENQIERSRSNLGLETIDVFYIHNPETQLAGISREVFHQRLKEAFAMLEDQVKSGNIRFYGVATWSAFRVPENAPDYISLTYIEQLARSVGGADHHLRFIQLPFSLATPEAYGLNNQRIGEEKRSVLSTAGSLGIAVAGSATLSQARLTRDLPDFVSGILGMKNSAGNAIQFARSTAGLTTSLIGMGRKEHVIANLEPARFPPTPAEEWNKLFMEQVGR
jgi:aryl-alcohol dehydrogenase-like predicted oxidoreductase